MVSNAKRKHIMLVVEKLAANRRFHEITLDEVADAAQVGKGTIYHYFKDKDDLFFQVATSGFDELCELFRRKVHHNGLFSSELLKTCKEIGKFFASRQELLQMMQSEAGVVCWSSSKIRQQWTAKRKMLIDAVASLLSDGIEQGVIRSDMPAETMAIFLLGMLRTRARDFDKTCEDIKSYEIVVDIFLNGVNYSRDKSLYNLAAEPKNFG